MKRMLCLASAFAFFAVVEAAPAPAGKKEEEKIEKKLEGDWTIESWVQMGQNIPLEGTWNFKADKYTLDQGGGNVEEGELKFGKDKKHNTLDMKITAGNCNGKNQVGILKLDGDTLTVCLAWPDDKDRPAEFESTADNKFILITLKKKK